MEDAGSTLKRKLKVKTVEEPSEPKEQQIESCSSSNQQHSEAETDDIEGDDEDGEPAEKMDVSQTSEANDVKHPKVKRVIFIKPFKFEYGVYSSIYNRKLAWNGNVKIVEVLLKLKKMLINRLCQKGLRPNLM